jgi:hypothetical protein
LAWVRRVGAEHAAPLRDPIHDARGIESEYSVVTWFGSHKAVAWAATIHSAQSPDKKIYQVRIEDLGEPELTASGYKLEPDEFTDRMEW